MKILSKTEIKLENFEKCSLICDFDCSLGQLFDFSCMLKSFIAQKIQENESQKSLEKNEE